MEEQEHKKRISFPMAVLLGGTSLLFDSLQDLIGLMYALPILGDVFAFIATYFLSFVAMAVFGIWFALLRVNYFDKNAAKKLLIMFSSIMVELIPLFNLLPGITFGVVALILQTWMEDGVVASPLLTKVVSKINPAAGKALKVVNEVAKINNQLRNGTYKSKIKKLSRIQSRPTAPANDNEPQAEEEDERMAA